MFMKQELVSPGLFKHEMQSHSSMCRLTLVPTDNVGFWDVPTFLVLRLWPFRGLAQEMVVLGYRHLCLVLGIIVVDHWMVFCDFVWGSMKHGRVMS